MIKIKHKDAYRLELLVKHVYGCERNGIMGLVNADYFEFNPWLAAILILAPKYRKSIWSRKELPGANNFFKKYENYFSAIQSSYDASVVEDYINDLNALVRRHYRGCAFKNK